MLGKLIKQELREGSKLMLLSHGFLILFSIISGVLVQLAISTKFLEAEALLPKIIFVIFLIVTIFLLIFSALVVMFYIAVRFYKNLFTDQGYLMFTLPTTASQLLHSKFISSLLWMIFNGVIVNICTGIIALPLISILPLDEMWPQIMKGLELVPTKVTLTFIALIIIGQLYCILYTYACICLGQLFNKSRILLSIVFYGIGLMILQFVIGVISLASTFNHVMTYSNTHIETFDESEFLTLQFESICNTYLYTTIILGVVSIASYFVCRYIMRKKLNLL